VESNAAAGEGKDDVGKAWMGFAGASSGADGATAGTRDGAEGGGQSGWSARFSEAEPGGAGQEGARPKAGPGFGGAGARRGAEGQSGWSASFGLPAEPEGNSAGTGGGLGMPADEERPGGGFGMPDGAAADSLGAVFGHEEARPADAAGEPPQKPKSKRALIVAAILVLVLGGGVFGASQIFARDFAELTMGPAAFAKKCVTDAANGLIDTYMDYAIYVLDNVGRANEAELSLTADVSEEYIDNLAEGLPYVDATTATIFHMIGKSSLKSDMSYQVSDGYVKAATETAWSANGKDIVTIKADLDQDAAYLSSPELYPDTLSVPLSDLGLPDGVRYFDLLRGSMPFLPEDFGADDLAALSRYGEEAKPMLKAMVAAAVEELDFTIEKNADVEINGASHSTHAVAVTASKSQGMLAAIAALEVIQGDEKYLSLISSIVTDISLLGGADASPDAIRTFLGEAIDEMRQEADAAKQGATPLEGGEPLDDGPSGGQDALKLKLYVSPQNKLLGSSFAVGGADIFFGMDGKGYECRGGDGVYDSFRVFGNISKSGGGIDFPVNFSVNGGSPIKALQAKGVKWEKYRGTKVLVGAFDFAVADWTAGVPGLEDGEDKYLSIAKELKGSANMYLDGETYGYGFTLGNGSDASLSLDIKEREFEGSIEMPDHSGAAGMESLDIVKLADGLKTVFDNMKEAGYDLQNLYETAASLLVIVSTVGNQGADGVYGGYDYSGPDAGQYDMSGYGLDGLGEGEGYDFD
jgi:hypothetical protein